MINFEKSITNLISFYGMLLAAVQQRLMELDKGSDPELEKELLISESYYQGILDAFEGVLSLMEIDNKVAKTNNEKYL